MSSSSTIDPDFNGLSIISYYENLPDPLKNQLARLESKFTSDRDIVPVAESLYKNYGRKYRKHPNIRRLVFRVAMLKVISPDFLFDDKWFPHVHCYDERDHKITFEKTLTIGSHVFVLMGKLNDTLPVVIKWYQSHRRDTSYEVGIYTKLRHAKLNMPWFSSTYRFWNSPVLVMERLHPLGPEDDEFKVGIEVLKQLVTVHTIGIHNDIKPGNVMKRVKNGQPIYFIIDYGGIATEKYKHGYRRWIWSPKWACQRPHAKNQVTTPKHDFIELGYTMKTMQNWRTKDTRIRGGFTGKLARYMDRVALIDEMNIQSTDYDDLIKILSE